MSDKKKNALISVSDKGGLEDLARALTRHGWELWASGGTAKWLDEQGFAVRSSAELTGFADLLGGRVKTLDARIHAGILARNEQDFATLRELGIPRFSLVVVNLYPFAEQAGSAHQEAGIELIDIGGPALLRAAAKNYQFTAPLASPDWYGEAISALDANAGILPADLAQEFATRTFALTSAYDGAIAAWYKKRYKKGHKNLQETAEENPNPLPAQVVLPDQQAVALNYGENPHQAGRLHRFIGAGGTANAVLLQPKDGTLSYNNHLDLAAAWAMANRFASTTPAVAVIKHTTPCGVAVAENEAKNKTGAGAELLQTALTAGGSDSYGGILATNFAPHTSQEVEAFSAVLQRRFLELVALPALPDAQAEREALAQSIKASGKRTRLVAVPQTTDHPLASVQFRSLTGGLLSQTVAQQAPLNLTQAEDLSRQNWQQVSGAPLNQEILASLACAWQVACQALSNAIVAVQKNEGVFSSLGIAGGQTSRVAACQQVAQKLAPYANSKQPIVAASDGFFPFADGLEVLAQAGVQAVVAPSGSKNDAQVAKVAQDLGLALLFSPLRGFRH